MFKSFGHNERVKVSLAAALTLFSFLTIWWQSRGNIEGGQDSWNHYLIARYAPVYHKLFLDQWGKPLFTLITTGVCQLGFKALVAFNLLCTLFTGLLCYFSARKLGYNNAWLVIIIACFCPVLMGNTISGLTEPLNAVLLAWVIYLWLYNRKVLSLLITSFLPFVRSEGFVIICAVLLFLLVSGHFKHIPLLLTGFLVYTVIGKLYYGTWNWVFGGNPYIKADKENATHQAPGELMHYLNNSRSIWGLLGLILIIAGIICLVIAIIKAIMAYNAKRKTQNASFDSAQDDKQPITDNRQPTTGNTRLIFEVFFISGIVTAYISVHSYIYWKGMLGSEGLLRVMAVITPCTALLALKGWNALTQWFQKKRYYSWLSVAVAAGLIINGYKENHYATILHPSQSPIKADLGLPNYTLAGNWLKQQGLLDGLLVHQIPRLNVEYNKDPDNIKQTYPIWSIDTISDWTPKNAIIFWDGYYSSREGKMPLRWLQQNPAYEQLKVFKATGIPKEFEGHYDIYIFRKK